jgi:hypothetical protein
MNSIVSLKFSFSGGEALEPQGWPDPPHGRLPTRRNGRTQRSERGFASEDVALGPGAARPAFVGRSRMDDANAMAAGQPDRAQRADASASPRPRGCGGPDGERSTDLLRTARVAK